MRITCLSCHGEGARAPTVVDLTPGATGTRVLETHCIECDGTGRAICYECGERWADKVVLDCPLCRGCIPIALRRQKAKRVRRRKERQQKATAGRS